MRYSELVKTNRGTCYIHLKNGNLIVMEGDEGVKEEEQLFILKNGKMVAMFQIEDVFQFYKLEV
jgi:hypothetical protein